MNPFTLSSDTKLVDFGFTGVCPVSELALKYLLTQKGSGNAVVIVVGGAAEALLCRPGVSTIFLKQRKGFVKLALKTGWVLRFWCPIVWVL